MFTQPQEPIYNNFYVQNINQNNINSDLNQLN